MGLELTDVKPDKGQVMQNVEFCEPEQTAEQHLFG